MTPAALLDGLIGSLLTIAVMCGLAYIAQRNGLIHFSLMRKAHELSVTKALPRVGCDVRCESRPINGPGYSPHVALIVKIYNEGELAAQKLTGQWEFSPRHPDKKRAFQIRRDYLGHCEQYSDEYLIPESGGWRREGISFDVEVEFFYCIPEGNETQHYEAHYSYSVEKEQMVRQDV